jgi:glycosyltransferase involved in cell wall biosynthesis
MSNKILVAICNYNHKEYLKQSIESIQNQTFENLDICVIDDGSADQEDVLDLMQEFSPDKRVRLITNKTNQGKWWCLNKAIETTDAIFCTSHDADDVSLKNRIEAQYNTLDRTGTYHNLCGFYHCWNEDHVNKYKDLTINTSPEEMDIINKDKVIPLVVQGMNHPGINHFYTGEIETAGVSALFYRSIWKLGLRFNPPGQGLRVLLSEDSDFNFRMAVTYQKTSIVNEKLYCYRRNTSTNKEEK